MIHEALAPAKVNLFLHVGEPDAAGMHPLSSLAVFADVGDRIQLRATDRPDFRLEGPFADALAGKGDNLVLRALQALQVAAGGRLPALDVVLDKRLPVAAGLGGGSSDAAAALRLARDVWAPAVGDVTLNAIMARLGADGPMCLAARPMLAEGYGERLSPPPDLPDLPAVLANPRAPASTPLVYRAYDAAGRFGGAAPPPMAAAYESPAEVARFLAGCRNDLEAPGAAVQPAAAEVLDTLRRKPGVLLARLSGSGATSFALCESVATAQALASGLRRERPNWWLQPCILGGNRIGDA